MSNFDITVNEKYFEFLEQENLRKNAPLYDVAEQVTAFMFHYLRVEDFKAQVDTTKSAVVVDGLQFTVINEDDGDGHLYGVGICPKCGKSTGNAPIEDIESLHRFVAIARNKCATCKMTLWDKIKAILWIK